VTEPSWTSPFSLLAAARVLARGGGLDDKLLLLAEQCRLQASASAAAIVLYDGDARSIATPDGVTTIPVEGLADAVGEAVSTRRPVWGGELSRATAALIGGATAASVVPLVVEDESGQTLVGILLLADGHAPDGGPDPSTREALQAIADLSAVAIHQTRLQGALDERGEYRERLARIDPLTGLADRRTFEQVLELELARATRQGTPLAVAVFDIDGLGAINERLGSGVGDDVLRTVAATIADRVRLIDTVARLGRDEFAIIAPGDVGGVVALRVRDAVAALPPTQGVRLSVSAGVAHHPDDGATTEEVLAAADRAMAAARSQGPGMVVGTRPTTP
jgi:diguanylate cyclase (GGDEF)-like protein